MEEGEREMGRLTGPKIQSCSQTQAEGRQVGAGCLRMAGVAGDELPGSELGITEEVAGDTQRPDALVSCS